MVIRKFCTLKDGRGIYNEVEYDNDADFDVHANHRLERNSTIQIQLEALRAGTHNFVVVAGEKVDISAPKTYSTSETLLSGTGTNTLATPSALTKYYVYLSNSVASYAPSSLRLSSINHTSGYLAASGNGANWRYVGLVWTNSSTQFDTVGSVVDLDIIPTYPEKVTCWHDESTSLVGNAVAYYVQSSQAYGFTLHQHPAADTDEFVQYIVLVKGVYTFKVLGITNVDRGIIDWRLNGAALVSTQDWYSAGITYNVIKSNTSLSITRSGQHRLTGKVNGKNGSASDYAMLLTKFWFTRTG